MPRKYNRVTLSRAARRLCCGLVLLLGLSAHAQDSSIQLALSTEPPNLNSLTSTDNVSFFVLLHTMEGLLNYGDGDTLQAGVAQDWQMTGTQVTFTLRDSARWSDGQPVTAADFIFAWQTALSPATASPYAFILFPLKNAEKIHRGELPPAALGVRASDSHHLIVELEQPTPWFLSLTTFPTYLPLREDIYRRHGNRYGAEADTLVYNGAFTLARWVHGASLELVRNPQYWQRERVALARIAIPHISNDPGTLFNLFQGGDIALAELGVDTLDHALANRLYIQSFANGMLGYLEFNHRAQRPTASLALRQAIAACIDRDELVNRVIAAPGTHPARRFFPAWLPQSADLPAPDHDTADERSARCTAARETLSTNSPLPPLTLLIYDAPAVVKQAEYLQKSLQDKLGLHVQIDRQIFKQKLAKLASGDFDLALSAWGPDFNDAMTFAGLLQSDNSNNHGRYTNAEYDRLSRAAGSQPDGPARNALFTQLADLIDRDVAVLPLAEPGILYVQDPKLQGVLRHKFGGDPDLRFARLNDGTKP